MQRTVTDQMGYDIEVPNSPQSIISLVPSQTELLYDLGLKDEIKGVTKFCIHPESAVREVPKIGGTKKFRFDTIKELKPDLLIGNKEENYKEGIEELKKEYPVWMSDVFDLSDALKMITDISVLVGKSEKGQEIVDNIREGFNQIEKKEPKRTLYFIWQKPYMVAGKSTFIDQMLQAIGLVNVIEEDRYPELTAEDIADFDPELILLSSEPFPFKAKHFPDFKELCPNADMHIVDGEMFSWYGSRLMKAPAYFNSLNI